MKTPTTIEALEGAIAMLRDILLGKRYPALEYMERLELYEAARDEHRRMEMVDERNRAQVRELSSKKRVVRL